MGTAHVTSTIEAPLRWSSPEAKLWVATREGEFAGFVEFREGHYVVSDGAGRELAPRATLREAKGALDPEGTIGSAVGHGLGLRSAGALEAAAAAEAAEVAAAVFAGEGDPRAVARIRRPVVLPTRALAAAAIALAGAALGTLAVALNVLHF